MMDALDTLVCLGRDAQFRCALAEDRGDAAQAADCRAELRALCRAVYALGLCGIAEYLARCREAP